MLIAGLNWMPNCRFYFLIFFVSVRLKSFTLILSRISHHSTVKFRIFFIIDDGYPYFLRSRSKSVGAMATISLPIVPITNVISTTTVPGIDTSVVSSSEGLTQNSNTQVHG